MTLPLYQVDAFTSQPFKGNPAAVCLLDEQRPDPWMLALAQEMNLSETAFLLPEADGYRLRWFTPAVEVSLCGHATLASAHILYETGRLAPGDTARFFTQSGLLTAAARPDGWIELDFPANPVEPVEPPPGLLDALGVQPSFVGRSSNHTYLVELASAAEVRRAAPDFLRLRSIESVRAVVVTSATQVPGCDFISRFFAPQMGINEDPVTGSAHTHLVPYWAVRLGQTSFTAYQASDRGGDLHLRLLGNRVGIAGQAVTVFTALLK